MLIDGVIIFTFTWHFRNEWKHIETYCIICMCYDQMVCYNATSNFGYKNVLLVYMLWSKWKHCTVYMLWKIKHCWAPWTYIRCLHTINRIFSLQANMLHWRCLNRLKHIYGTQLWTIMQQTLDVIVNGIQVCIVKSLATYVFMNYNYVSSNCKYMHSYVVMYICGIFNMNHYR